MLSSWNKPWSLKGNGAPSHNHRGVPNTRTLIKQGVLFNPLPIWPLALNKRPFTESAEYHICLCIERQKCGEIKIGEIAHGWLGTRVKDGGRKGRQEDRETRETINGWKTEGNGQWKERMTQTSIIPFINFHPILPSKPLFPQTGGSGMAHGSSE